MAFSKDTTIIRNTMRRLYLVASSELVTNYIRTKLWVRGHPSHSICIFKIRKLQFCRVWGGSDCSHCRSTSLQAKFNSSSWGGDPTAVTADQLHCRPSSTPHPGGGPTAVTAGQVQLLILGGGFNCSHCKVQLKMQ